MDIVIRNRKTALSDGTRAAVDDKIGRVGRFLDGMDRAEVCFTEQRNPRIADKELCEVTVHGHGHIVRAHASGPDLDTALDRVVDKLEQRMARLKGRLSARSHPRRNGSVSSGADHTRVDDDTEVNEDHPRIVKTKRFEIKPMTPEEAALQMDLLGHDFFFFMNAETSLAAVVYRRSDGHVGLIDAT